LTFSADVTPDLQYIYVAIAPNDVLQILAASIPNFPAGSTSARYSIIHAFPAEGALDVYLVPAGTALGSVAAQGSITFGPTPATFAVTPETLRLYLTPAGDPNTILFESTDLVALTGTDNVLVVHDVSGQTPVSLGVSLMIGDTTLRVNRQGDGALLRVVQGVDDRLARDVILDDAATTPLFSSQPFGELSEYTPVSAAEHTLTLTPVGAPATEESSAIFTTVAGRYYTAIYAGDTTTGIDGIVAAEDPRPIVNQSSLYIANAAGLFGDLRFYILPPGTDVNLVAPRILFTAPHFPARTSLLPGDYEITVVDDQTRAVLAGPEPVTLAEKGVYGVLLLNAADNVTIDLEYFYDFSP
jgi:DNA-binding beta-propeller fold protein YncE